MPAYDPHFTFQNPFLLLKKDFYKNLGQKIFLFRRMACNFVQATESDMPLEVGLSWNILRTCVYTHLSTITCLDNTCAQTSKKSGTWENSSWTSLEKKWDIFKKSKLKRNVSLTTFLNWNPGSWTNVIFLRVCQCIDWTNIFSLIHYT